MLRFLAVTFLLAATPAAAHEPDVGPNGGARVDAGPYRVELVPGDTSVIIHLTLDDGGPVDTSAMTGTAILIVDSKPLRLSLAPAEPGTLAAETQKPVPAEVKGAVQLNGPDGVAAQAKF